LFVSSATRKENKRADAVRMQRNQHFPTEPFNELGHVWDVKVIECSNSGRMESEQHPGYHGSMAELIVDPQ
jgi:hypothetical protein